MSYGAVAGPPRKYLTIKNLQKLDKNKKSDILFLCKKK